MRISVWSSDVCSSELRAHRLFGEIAHPAPAIRPRFAADLIEQQRDRIDHARDLELAITGIAVTGLAPGADLRAAAPAREPRGGGPTEEQRMAAQRLNFAFALGRDIVDNAAHLLDTARARGDRIAVFADR